MDAKLKYTGEDDKCYGITGMVIGMMVWDSENLLSSVSLDAHGDETIDFVHDFYFSGNPQMSAKVAWNKNVEQFHLLVGLLISNVMCRNYVLNQSKINRELKGVLLNIIKEVGQESCSLENDEIEQLFDKSYNYLNRIFSHHGVQGIVRDFTETLKRQRWLSKAEIIEQLQALSQL